MSTAREAVRHQAEEGTYRRLFERNLTALFRTTLDGRPLDCNDAFARLYGYESREEVLQSSCESFYCKPEDRQAYVARLQRDGVVHNYELCCRRRDGTPIWVLSNAILVCGTNGEPDVIEGTDVDITERKRAEGRLQESERLFRTLAEAAPVAIGILDEGRLVYVNAAAEELFGRSREELVSADLWPLIHPESVPLMQQRAAARLRGEPVPSRYQVRILRKDGTARWLDVGAARSEFAGRPCIVLAGYDITDHRQAEASLRQNHELLHAVAEGTSDAVFVKDLEGRYLMINSAGAAALGHTIQEVLGWTDFELQPRDVAEIFRAGDLAALNTEGAVTHEERAVSPTGVRYFLATKAPYRDAEGALKGVIGISHDITERKRAEEELRIRTTALEAAANAIIITDRQANIVWANPAFTELTGYSLEEAVGLNPRFLQSGRHGKGFYQEVWQTILSGRTWKGEIYNRRKDGSIYVEEMTITPVAQGGEVTHFVAIKQDVTERRQAEEALRRSEERYRLVTRATRDAVWDWNVWTGELVWNDAVETLFGQRPPTADEDGYAWWLERVHPEDRERTSTALQSALKGNDSVIDLEYRFRRGDGSYATVIDQGYIIRTEKGEPLRMIGAMADITARRQAEENLRQSEEKFSKAFHSSPTPMTISSLHDGRYLDVNQAFLQMTGYSRGELIGHSALELGMWCDPADRGRWIASLQSAGGVIDHDFAFRHKNGERRIGVVSAHIIQAEGETCVLSVARDLTEQRRAQEALRRSELRFRQLFESSLIGLHIAHLDGRVLLANDAWLKMTGYTREDVAAGRVNWRTMTPAEHRESDEKAAEQLRAKRFAAPWEKEYVRKDGTRVPVLIGVSMLAGSTDEAMAFILDVSERKRAEEERERLYLALQRAATEWRDTFDALQSPVLLLDGAHRILRINRAGQQLAGRPYLDLPGLDIRELSGQPWQAAAELAGRLCEADEVLSLDIHDELADRSWQIEAFPLSAPETEGRTILVLRDTTELVKLQETLLRAESLSTLGSLVAGVAHEVRNPLFGISSTLDAFEVRLGTQPGHERYIRALRRETDRMAELMKQLLELGKPSSPDRILIDLREILQQAVQTSAPLARHMGVNVVLRSHTPADVLAERLRLIQVFQNLLENSIQHSSAGQTVEVEWETTEEAGGPSIECRILDSGSGIAAEDLEHIFEPFFSRRSGGTGLGLSIVQRIVEEHGGTITILNRPQGGTEARVSLPRAAAPAVHLADAETIPVQ
ncbi:MAG TPA: PAS domain S-box protein [Terriglobales bacterium]|nr:PAS domain S-box protein [Terriglobales bacterium]